MAQKNKQEYKVEKGTFVLNMERTSIPTDDTMYDCEDCKEEKIEHKIISKPSEPTDRSSCWGPGVPTRIRICTGCDRYDGPWVSASIVGGFY